MLANIINLLIKNNINIYAVAVASALIAPLFEKFRTKKLNIAEENKNENVERVKTKYKLSNILPKIANFTIILGFATNIVSIIRGNPINWTTKISSLMLSTKFLIEFAKSQKIIKEEPRFLKNLDSFCTYTFLACPAIHFAGKVLTSKNI